MTERFPRSPPARTRSPTWWTSARGRREWLWGSTRSGRPWTRRSDARCQRPLQGALLAAGFVPVVAFVHALGHANVGPAVVEGDFELLGRRFGRLLRRKHPPGPVPVQV